MTGTRVESRSLASGLWVTVHMETWPGPANGQDNGAQIWPRTCEEIIL